MDINAILEELREERDRLQRAIEALERAGGTGKGKRGRKPGRHMSLEARRRIGIAMKKQAERKKKAAA